MFDHLRQTIFDKRLRAQGGRRLTEAELADRAIAKEAPRWKVLTNQTGQHTLLWEVAPGWFQHAWGDTPALLVSNTEHEATAHVDQDIGMMGGTVNRDIHPDWTDADWERERVESNHDVFDELEAAGFDAYQETDWRH